MKKFCVKCGRQFDATGREVICPACKAQAAEESKKAAVLKAKRASWTGESVPVRISGRASTVIREYAAANGMPFASALDALLQSTPSFQAAGQAWEDITPYKSRRRKSATEDEPQAASKSQDKTQAAQAAKTSKTTNKKTASTSKAAAGKKEGKKA